VTCFLSLSHSLCWNGGVWVGQVCENWWCLLRQDRNKGNKVGILRNQGSPGVGLWLPAELQLEPGTSAGNPYIWYSTPEGRKIIEKENTHTTRFPLASGLMSWHSNDVGIRMPYTLPTHWEPRKREKFYFCSNTSASLLSLLASGIENSLVTDDLVLG